MKNQINPIFLLGLIFLFASIMFVAVFYEEIVKGSRGLRWKDEHIILICCLFASISITASLIFRLKLLAKILFSGIAVSMVGVLIFLVLPEMRSNHVIEYSMVLFVGSITVSSVLFIFSQTADDAFSKPILNSLDDDDKPLDQF